MGWQKYRFLQPAKRSDLKWRLRSASFAVAGSGSYTYAITLPTSVVIANGVNVMTVDTFTSSPATTGTLTAGAQTLTVGATLNLIASQVAGTYTSATPFSVTVNYN